MNQDGRGCGGSVAPGMPPNCQEQGGLTLGRMVSQSDRNPYIRGRCAALLIITVLLAIFGLVLRRLYWLFIRAAPLPALPLLALAGLSRWSLCSLCFTFALRTLRAWVVADVVLLAVD